MRRTQEYKRPTLEGIDYFSCACTHTNTHTHYRDTRQDIYNFKTGKLDRCKKETSYYCAI